MLTCMCTQLPLKCDAVWATLLTACAVTGVQAGGWYNSVATPIIQAAGLDILNAFPETVPLWSFHMWDKDCTHYCMPGPYELWTYLLAQKLKTMTFRD